MATPETSFEARGHSGWSSFSEEADYVDALLSAEPSVTRNTVGYGTNGEEIYELTVGTGSTHVLYVAQQHGDEPAGRDGLLTLVRDLAQSTDSAIVSYLQDVTVHAIPTPRPDSLSSRTNPNGVNLNRDHGRLTQSETRAIHRVINDYDPVIILDLHEKGSSSPDTSTSPSVNPNIHPDLLSLGDDANTFAQGAIIDNGYTTEDYLNLSGKGPEFLSQCGGIRHAIGYLTETSTAHDDQVRHSLQIMFIKAFIDWHIENFDALNSAQQESMNAAVNKSSVELVTSSDTNGPLLSPTPGGYDMSPSGLDTIDYCVDLFGLSVEAGRVDARHMNRVLVHYLLDRDSSSALVTGARWYDTVQPPIDGEPVPPMPTAYFRTGGVTYPARWPGL